MEVLEPESPPEEQEMEEEADESMSEEPTQDTSQPAPLSKMKLFSGKTAPGLRIRKAPSLIVSGRGLFIVHVAMHKFV